MFNILLTDSSNIADAFMSQESNVLWINNASYEELQMLNHILSDISNSHLFIAAIHHREEKAELIDNG